MAKEVLIEKEKFDRLLGKMLQIGPLPKKDVKVANPKPKKAKSRRRRASS